MSTEKFHYEHDGKTITLPHLKNLPFGVIRKLRHEEPGEQLFGILEHVADAASLAALDELGMGQVQDLFDAWQAASGVEMGESSASSTS